MLFEGLTAKAVRQYMVTVPAGQAKTNKKKEINELEALNGKRLRLFDFAFINTSSLEYRTGTKKAGLTI